MNYERIAEMVHRCVKNPNNLNVQENGLAEMEVKTEEFSVIQTVFSRFEVSGDAIAFEDTTLAFWY